MTAPRTVAVLVGSLRKASLSRKVAQALAGLAPAGLTLEIVEIGELPLYNEDLETGSPPPAWTALRDQLRAADAILYVTPEYNRGLPGVLKNAVDVASRPYGQGVLGKPSGVVSTSQGALGGFGANHQLRQALVFADAPVLAQPEAYLGGTGGYFDETGALAKDDTRALLTKFINAFAAFVGERTALEAPRNAA